MYAVFERTLLTDKGKALVRHHQLSFDAQTIYKELTAYAKQSTKATMDASTLLSYITTTNLGDGKWKGPTHGFVLYWQDQVRKYQDLNPQPPLAPEFLCTLLQNAVHPIAELRQIKVQSAQLKAFTGRDLSYDQYCTLLLSAAQQYDQQNALKGDKVVKRRIYQHDTYSDHVPVDDFQDADVYDIDRPLDLMQAYATNFNRGARLSYGQWKALPDDAKQIWDTLSEEAKAIILRPPPEPDPTHRPTAAQRPTNRSSNPPPRRPFQPRRTVNEHEIEYLAACLHELHGGDIPPSHDADDTSVQEDITNQTEDQQAQPLLAHMTKKKPLPPGNVKRLLSQASNNDGRPSQPQEVNLNGIIYQQVNMAS